MREEQRKTGLNPGKKRICMVLGISELIFYSSQIRFEFLNRSFNKFGEIFQVPWTLKRYFRICSLKSHHITKLSATDPVYAKLVWVIIPKACQDNDINTDYIICYFRVYTLLLPWCRKLRTKYTLFFCSHYFLS